MKPNTPPLTVDSILTRLSEGLKISSTECKGQQKVIAFHPLANKYVVTLNARIELLTGCMIEALDKYNELQV